MEVEELRIHHLRRIQKHTDFDDVTLSVYWSQTKGSPQGWAKAIVDGDHVMSCFGAVYVVGTRVIETWMLINPRIKVKQIEFLRKFKREFEEFIKRVKYFRIQAHATEENVKAHRILKSIGFKEEGLLHNFPTENSNMKVFAIWQPQQS